MRREIAHLTLVVRDYDEAIEHYTRALGFELVEDTDQGDKRWVVVSPPGSSGANLVLARASTPAQEAAIGNQTGGRVAFFLSTDDFQRDFDAFTAAGVEFEEPPRTETYGIVAIFRDLYGNRWDLIQYT